MATAPIILLIWSPWLHPSNGVPLPVYMTSRDELLAKERGQRVGGRLVLSEKEQKVGDNLEKKCERNVLHDSPAQALQTLAGIE